MTYSRTFPNHELIERAHAGASTEIWKAYRRALELPVSLKVFAPHEEWDDAVYLDWQALFLNEAEVLCRLQHPSIVRFYDLVDGHIEGDMAIVLEQVQGVPLSKVRLDPDLAGMVAVRVLSAIQYLQRPMQIGRRNYAAVIHGDIKPDNIMIAPDGVRLIDFGFACPDPLLDQKAICGTPRYLSPERLEGKAPTWKDDGYALAVTLFEQMGLPLGSPASSLDRKHRNSPILRTLWRLKEGKFPSPTAVIRELEADLGNHNYSPQIAALASLAQLQSEVGERS